MGKFDLAQNAKAVFSQYETALTDAQYSALSAFAASFSHENDHVQNLSAIHDADEIWVRHFLDAAMLCPHIPQKARVLDLGTGGGIPGIPLAILRPDLDISLLDSEQKKLLFCEKATVDCGADIRILWGRAEELGRKPELREQFDFVVSRAMASCSMLFELGVPFLKPHGVLIAMKGRNFDPEAERLTSACEALGLAHLPDAPYEIEGEHKVLISVQRGDTLDDRYPRRFAKIRREPL